MRNDFIEHSFKGTSWKKGHLYTKKEGDRYFYTKANSHNVADSIIGTPNLEGASIELGKNKIVQMLRDVLNTPIWSPNPKDTTLISRGKDKINSLFRVKQPSQISAKSKKR